jgi:Protein of unknown function (DUF3467)
MHSHPDDRPDPTEQPIRARVPEHVAGGCFSTGVIVMTAQTEFILDFVQNLGRPHQIVARVVMPHGVLPQLVDALGRNMQLYRSRWGELPNPTQSNQTLLQGQLPTGNSGPIPQAPDGSVTPVEVAKPAASPPVEGGTLGPGPATQVDSGIGAVPFQPAATASNQSGQDGSSSYNPLPSQSAGETPVRQANAQEIYDDLKIRDEILSGSYANAVMIGHGPHEFSFDFITNFYPNSAVSARVFLAAGQIPRLYESLKGTWEQLRQRMQPPPGSF